MRHHGATIWKKEKKRKVSHILCAHVIKTKLTKTRTTSAATHSGLQILVFESFVSSLHGIFWGFLQIASYSMN